MHIITYNNCIYMYLKLCVTKYHILLPATTLALGFCHPQRLLSGSAKARSSETSSKHMASISGI